jgi:hypothetical protein
VAAVRIDETRPGPLPLPLAIAPHESLMLTVQFGRDATDAKAEPVHCSSATAAWTAS